MNTKHLRVLVLALALPLAALAPVPPAVHASVYTAAPPAVHASVYLSAGTCARDPYDDFWTYYSDATMTTVVGTCENDCGLYCHCSGTITPYYRVTTSRNC